MRWPRRSAAVAALAALLAADVSATEKTVVGVRLVIEADNFRRVAPDTTVLIDDVQKKAAEELNRMLPFVRFVPGTSDRYVLALRLAPLVATKPGSNRGTVSPTIGFHICMIDRGKRGNESFTTVRLLGHERGVGTWEVASAELMSVIKDLKTKSLVDSVFCDVSIADSARFSKDEFGWVLPFKRTDLCLDDFSDLRVHTEMPTTMSRRSPFQYSTVLQGVCEECGDMLVLWGQGSGDDKQRARAKADSIRTVGVYVKDLKAFEPCPSLPPPGGGLP